MTSARAFLVLALLPLGGCFNDGPPAPEEVALDRYDDADVQLAAGRYEEAAQGYEYAILHRSRWKEAYVKLARCREAQGRDADAAAVLERLLGIDRFDEEALRTLGRLYARLGSTDQALLRYRRLRDLRPEDRSLDGEIARLEALRKP